MKQWGVFFYIVDKRTWCFFGMAASEGQLERMEARLRTNKCRYYSIQLPEVNIANEIRNEHHAQIQLSRGENRQ